jgi:DNA repair protein RecO (recombination protein O)
MIEQNAFVLHSRPFKENQLIVDLLTENYGRLTATVFVGQSKRSIKKGLIQPFLPLKLILKEQGHFKQIQQIDTIAQSIPLKKNSLFSGFYLNELLIRLLTEQIACQPLFYQYQSTLLSLSVSKNIAAPLRIFELSLIEELGLSFDFSPVFSDDAQYFDYIPEQGFVAINNLTAHNKKNYFHKNHLEIIAQPEFLNNQDEYHEVSHTFKLLMRQVINQLLGNKPLNSRKLFAKNEPKLS